MTRPPPLRIAVVCALVAGVVDRVTEDLQGAAPGADLVSLSTGAGLVIIGADAALNWVLENHEAPCGAGVSAAPVRRPEGPAGSGGV